MEMEIRTLSRGRRLLLLYCSFFRITALVVGGGLAMLPVIEEIFVVKRKLLTREELLDMTALTQTVPGIIAINSAVYIGMKVAGVPGAIAAAAGAVTPPFTVILVIASLFPHLDPKNRYLLGVFAGIRAAVTGMILVTGCRMFRRTVKSPLEIAVVLFKNIIHMSPAMLKDPDRDRFILSKAHSFACLWQKRTYTAYCLTSLFP